LPHTGELVRRSLELSELQSLAVCLETDKARAERAQRTKEKEVRALAHRISSYGRKVHRHYPTGDVVVGENDLAARAFVGEPKIESVLLFEPAPHSSKQKLVVEDQAIAVRSRRSRTCSENGLRAAKLATKEYGCRALDRCQFRR
jgi:hypothetical protein